MAPSNPDSPPDIGQQISDLAKSWHQQIAGASDLEALEAIRIEALGRKGPLSEAMRGIGKLPHTERQVIGQSLNIVKKELGQALDAREAALAEQALQEKLARETVDVTLPPGLSAKGALHPITRTCEDILAIFAGMGFSTIEGPDIEDDYHNFTALNMPPDHPARQMHDTFYLCDENGHLDWKTVLRTHTSPGQIRAMEASKPPIRVVVPGRTYRSDSDITHTPMFHQVEGLVIDRTTHFGHLKGCLSDFCAAFFELDNPPLRFRPSYFPFTEPSAEVDIGYARREGGLLIGGGDDWLEILGCGMVNPKVLEMAGIDPTVYQGFAFGMGVERLAMLKYGMPDLRTFFESDMRWLHHYGFSPFASAG